MTSPETHPQFAPGTDLSGTRDRLLDAAGRVFAERGYGNATVREICTLAGANVAAINYHFGDKKRLYAEVLHHTLEIARERHPIQLEAGGSPSQRLHGFIAAFLMRILDEGRPAWHGKLMAREMVDPTSALEVVAESVMRPTFALLRGIIADLMDRPGDAEVVKRCAFSVLGQCVMYKHCRPAILKLSPGEPQDAASIARLAAHICAFSVGGIRAMANEQEGSPCTGSR